MSDANPHYLLTYTDGTSNKFWRCEVFNVQMYVTYGRIDGTPQRQVKAFPSQYRASEEAQKKRKEKVKKGYQPVPASQVQNYPDSAPVRIAALVEQRTSVGSLSNAVFNPPPQGGGNRDVESVRVMELDD